MSANPEFYPYTDDPSAAYQLCDNTMYQMSAMHGDEVDPSIFMGSSRSLGTTFVGMKWTQDSRVLTNYDGADVFSQRGTGMFGLADGTSGFGSSTYFVNQTSNYFAIKPDANNQNIWGASRGRYNTNRWATGKESVNNSYYSFKPVVKLKKGACVGYMSIKAYKPIPIEFESVAAANAFFGDTFSGTLSGWEAVKEQYPHIFEISLTFKAGAIGGNNRTKTLYLFFQTEAPMNGTLGGAYDGGWVNVIPDGYPREGEGIGGTITPASSKHICYPAVSNIFRGGHSNLNISEQFQTIYGTCQHFYNWYVYQGVAKNFHTLQSHVWNGEFNNPINYVLYNGDPRDLLREFAEMGFAMTDEGSNTAQRGDIPTDPHIWTPTYDDAGNIDGVSNDSDAGQEYVDGGISGDDINPNFDPYAAEEEGDDPIPDEDPSEDQKTDEIDLPDVTLTSYGVFNRSYVLSKQNLQALSDYLWNGEETTWDSILEDLKLVGDNRMNSIINVIMFPFVIPNDEDVHRIRIGRHTTDVSAAYLDSSQNIVFDMGECFFYPKHKNFLDYEPYTKAWLYIPFIGLFEIPTQQFVNKYIHIKLAVDVLTGSGQAVVYAGGIPIIYKNCKIGMQIPVTGSDSGYVIRNYLEAVKGGAQALGSYASGNMGGTVSGLFNMATSALASQGAPIQSEGSASPQCGMLMPNKCYFVVEYPKTIMSQNPDYGHLVGYACRKTGQVGDFHGFSRFENVTLNISHCTDAERNEIIELLKSGVYV